jgi:hypothetical protein
LCAEVHSFSRVFTGAFYDILSGMLAARARKPRDADLVAVARDYARLLVAASGAAPVQPDYFAQVAAHMIDADTVAGGQYRDALTSVFVDRKILPAAAVAPLLAHAARLPARNTFGMGAAQRRPEPAAVHRFNICGREFDRTEQPIVVEAPVERKPFLMVAAAAAAHDRTGPARAEQAARRFVQNLFAHDRVDVSSRKKKFAAAAAPRTHANLKKTHVLVEHKDGLRLVRRHFNCGCALPGRLLRGSPAR